MSLVRMACMIVSVIAVLEGTSHWSYKNGETGPSHWFQHYPNCGLNKQSPINIKEDSTIYEPSNLETVLGSTSTVTNNKHSVSFGKTTLKLGVKINGVLYRFNSFHFHWGKDKKRGSEHTLNGKAFSAEMHLVHYNTKYSSLEVAASKEDGLAVLAVFLKERHKVKDNDLTACLLKSIQSVSMPGTKQANCSDALINAYSLLPKGKCYFTYDGSLTTPPCYQSVKWAVFRKPVSVSSEFMAGLRNLKINEVDSLVDNFRPVQKLNNRVVTKSFQHSKSYECTD